jgi:predicted RNA binding protein YcfA (HicA-like mRNA interferase family)
MKPIPASRFRKYLKSKGLFLVRTAGGHEIWDNKNKSLRRPIIFQAHFKEIPIFHIKTNLKTLGISLTDFESDINNF